MGGLASAVQGPAPEGQADEAGVTWDAQQEMPEVLCVLADSCHRHPRPVGSPAALESETSVEAISVWDAAIRRASSPPGIT
jgi:hypothetical protein